MVDGAKTKIGMVKKRKVERTQDPVPEPPSFLTMPDGMKIPPSVSKIALIWGIIFGPSTILLITTTSTALTVIFCFFALGSTFFATALVVNIINKAIRDHRCAHIYDINHDLKIEIWKDGRILLDRHDGAIIIHILELIDICAQLDDMKAQAESATKQKIIFKQLHPLFVSSLPKENQEVDVHESHRNDENPKKEHEENESNPPRQVSTDGTPA